MMDVAVIRLKFIFFLLSLGLILPVLAWAAEITVTVDRNPVSVDESFQIVFTAAQTPDGEPDFSPLQRDFSVLGRSQTENSSWVNGVSTQVSKWMVTVMAKHAGALTIPAVSFGGDRSQPLTITVKPAAAQNPQLTDNPELFLDVSATPENPYLQAQVIYTLKLYTRVDVAQARLSEPELADAVIEKIGDDSTYSSQVNGVDYTVSERSYAIFPQKSGSMTIKPLELTAEIVNGQSSFNSFFNTPVTRSKRLQSKPVTLRVRPRPASFAGTQWLPAEQLELSQQWSGDVSRMQVGEPLTRTLTLTAHGASVGQLPRLNAGTPDAALKIYPDQPELQEEKAAGGVIARRQEKLALMLSQPGTYVLPEIVIPWFNTVTEKMELAKLPAITLSAHGLATASAKPVAVAAPKEQSQAPQPAAPSQAAGELPVWRAATIFLALGWLATLGYFLARPKTRIADKAPPTTGAARENFHAQLRRACAADDAAGAKQALLAWGREQFGATSLGALAPCCEARLREEIVALNETLYAKEARAWQGKKLFQAFSENRARKKVAGNRDDGLKPLYP